MEVTRELELDAPADAVWELVSDPDELACWVGDEVRDARLSPPESSPEGAGRSLRWTWAPDGIESEVQVEIHEVGERTLVRVVERLGTSEHASEGRAGDGHVTGAARACAIGDGWDDRLFGLEVRCLTRAMSLARI